MRQSRSEAFSALATADAPVQVPAGQSIDLQTPISCPQAELWELSAPNLYNLHATLSSSANPPIHDDATKTFGFRSFEPRGIGHNAGLYLNDQRVRLYTAISWGFWGLNGLWPTPDLAEKEVRAAKQLNLNMLNFHRDIGKEEVLAQQDQLGLLRYMEPGGGVGYFRKLSKAATEPISVDTSGAGGEPTSFFERYLDAKITRMVRQFRSHPSLVIYVLQNETETDFSDPHLFYLLRKVHELDPSRVVEAKSGISPNHQAWFAPYANAPQVDDGTGYSGWRDQHTVGGDGVWRDDLYQGPDKFTHQIDDRKEIVDWGEMLGAAVPDNHPQMVAQIKSLGGASYDLQVHQQLADTYEQFLKKWGFTAPFPTGEAFFRDIGNKEYEFWARVIEAARLSESNDILTISGWESTAIENHSGLVDNLRNFHGDPTLLAPKLAPLLPIVELRSSVLNTGDSATMDIYLLNETGHAATGNLILTLKDPTGVITPLKTFVAPNYVPDRFVYPIITNVKTPPLSIEGKYSIEISLDGPTPAQNSQSLLTIQNIAPQIPAATVGILGDDTNAAIKELSTFPKLTLEPYQPGKHYDLLVAASAITDQKSPALDTGVPQGVPQGLTRRSATTQTTDAPPILTPAALEAIRTGTPLLILAGHESQGISLAKQLASAGAIEYLGSVPTARASWMGNWIFIRNHPLYAGLPTNETAKGDYQISVKTSYGLLIDGPHTQIIAAYGRDHDPHLGAATFTTKLANTPIVFQTIAGMHPIAEQRFLGNALLFLLTPKH